MWEGSTHVGETVPGLMVLGSIRKAEQAKGKQASKQPCSMGSASALCEL